MRVAGGFSCDRQIVSFVVKFKAQELSAQAKSLLIHASVVADSPSRFCSQLNPELRGGDLVYPEDCHKMLSCSCCT
jgi:hypothetical protein